MTNKAGTERRAIRRRSERSHRRLGLELLENRLSLSASLPDGLAGQFAFLDTRGPAAFAGPDRAARVDELVEFAGQGSSPDDEIRQYTWDFDSDGTTDFSSAKSGLATHRFSVPGEYDCLLTVIDSQGRVARDTQHVRVVEENGALTSCPRLLSSKPVAARAADGTVHRYAIMLNGANEDRFWTDVQLAYDMLATGYGFTAADIYLLNYNGKNPSGSNPNGMIDYAASTANLQTVVGQLAALADADDEVFVWITGHGRGYNGPLSEGGRTFAYCDGRMWVDPGNESDYPESSFQLRALATGGDYNNPYNHGMNQWAVYRKYSTSTKTSYYRNKYVSHLENVYITGLGTTVSDSDVYLERLVDYAAGDVNRDGFIDTAAGEVFDFDGDGVPPYDPATRQFDEGDWGDVDNLEDDWNSVNCQMPAGGRPYKVFDEGLQGKICIDLGYTGGPLHVDGRDENNSGLFSWMDVNQDGDTLDTVSVDEAVCLYSDELHDDELSALLDQLQVGKMTIVAEPCFSGGLVWDLSAPNRVICTATIEEAVSWGNNFIRAFVAALHRKDEYGKPVADADADGNGGVSMLEAFNYAVGKDPNSETPQYDDNGDGVSHPCPVPSGGDGILGSQTYLGELLPRATIYSASMDADPGWTTTGQWAFGHPTGGGGGARGFPDPSNGSSGSNVVGVNLSGDYSTTVGGPYYATTPVIDCSRYTNVTLQFNRWLNTDYGSRVGATIDVWSGSTWTNIYSNPTGSAVTDNAWKPMAYTLASADQKAAVQVRWGYQVKQSGAYAYSGWNIDDVLLTGSPHYIPPVLTDLNISISGATGSGGAYRIGDTVTATWNNTVAGDNNPGVLGVTVDFSQFGAASPVTAVQTPAGSNLWTASYVIVAGTIDGRVGNVSVTATNDVGSTTTADTTNATVDNVAPAVQITAVTPDPRDALVDEVTVAFSEPILGLDLADLSLTRDGGADLLTGSETLSTVDNITWTLGGLAAHTASGAGGPGGFAAFNDHAPAAGATHANATTYATNGTPSGTLKDIASGGAVGAMLTVTQAGANLASGSTNPASGTPAYQMFHGFVDFSGVTGASIELEAVNNDYYLHTFSALDTGSAATYNFHGTAVRGNSSYTRRWTKVTLVGAASAAPDHTPGNGVLVLSNTEVALWTGYNSAASQGFVAGWKDIDPGPDGQFAVRSEQYTGAIPAAIDAGGWANDVKGYALAGVRLEAVVPSEPIPGEYVLALQAAGAGIQDAAGNPLAAGASETFTIDTQPPTAAIGPVAPDPRITPVETVAITFDEPVTGFDLTDLALTRDGGANLLTGEQTLTTADSRTWTLGNLGGLTTARGSYGLVLTAAGSGIQDLLGHALTGDASESWLTAPGYVLGTGGKDVIRIVCNAFGAAKVDVFVNNDSVPCDTVIRTDVPSWLVAGGEGDDELTVDFTRGSPLPPGPAVGLLFDGASGSDVLHVVDPSGDGAVATATQVIVGDAAHVGFSNVEGCRFELGAGKLTKIGDGVLVLAGNSRYSGATEVLCGTLVVSSADSLPAGGNLTIGSDGTVVLSSGLNVGGAGVAAPSLASPALATPVPDALTANIEQAGGTSSSANSPAAPTLTAAPVQRAGPVAMTMQFQPVIDTMTARSVPFATAGGKAVVSQLPSAAKAAAATESAARPVPAPPTQIKARDAVLQTLTLPSRSDFSWVWAIEESWSRKQIPKKNAVALSAADQALGSLSP